MTQLLSPPRHWFRLRLAPTAFLGSILCVHCVVDDVVVHDEGDTHAATGGEGGEGSSSAVGGADAGQEGNDDPVMGGGAGEDATGGVGGALGGASATGGASPVVCGQWGSEAPPSECPRENKSVALETEDRLAGLVVDAEDDRVYVADAVNNQILVFTRELSAITTFPLSFSPYRLELAKTQQGKRLLVTGDNAAWLNLTTGEVACSFGVGYVGGYNSSTDTLFVGHDAAKTLGVYDATTCAPRASAVDLGFKAGDIAVDEYNNLVYAALHHDDSISVVDGASYEVLENIDVLSGDPTDLSLLLVEREVNGSCALVPQALYVGYSIGAQMTVLSLGDEGLGPRIQNTVDVAQQPRLVSTDPRTGRTYVSYMTSSTLGWLDEASADSVNLPFNPHFHAIDETTGCVFLTSHATSATQSITRNCSLACF